MTPNSVAVSSNMKHPSSKISRNWDPFTLCIIDNAVLFFTFIVR
jgi:hypothetical protein